MLVGLKTHTHTHTHTHSESQTISAALSVIRDSSCVSLGLRPPECDTIWSLTLIMLVVLALATPLAPQQHFASRAKSEGLIGDRDSTK